jgi:hypothetical protein
LLSRRGSHFASSTPISYRMRTATHVSSSSEHAARALFLSRLVRRHEGFPRDLVR